jgi:hypothetical protein
VISRDGILAIFTIETSQTLTKVDQVCILPGSTNETANEMSNLTSQTPTLILAPPQIENALSDYGREEVEVRYARTPKESRVMQLLPLANPGEKDVLELSRLMSEAYAECRVNRDLDTAVAEKSLRRLMSGQEEIFLQDSSFISRAGQKIVSACSITKEHVGAAVTEVFTHPLYRARGLATTELATCMNSLAKAQVPLLSRGR